MRQAEILGERAVPAHVFVLCALLAAFLLSGAMSFLYGTRAEGALEASLQQNISMLSKLPKLRDHVREIDLLTDLYLRTGDAAALERRRRSIDGLVEMDKELRELSTARPSHNVLARFDRELGSLLDLQQRSIDARASRISRPPGAREREAARNRRDDVLEIISTFGDQAALELQGSEFDVQKTSGRLYVARFAIELLIAALVSFYLFYYILRPLRVVEEVAAVWRLGTPWPEQTLSSLPEIRGMITHFGDMATRLNVEFGKVQEFSQFKTKLVSVVSHEFGNALAVMQAAVFLLREHLPEEHLAENEPFLDMLSANISGLTEATTNILDLARHEAGQLAVDFGPTDAAKVLFDVMRRLQLLFEKRNLHVSLELPERLKPVRADRATLTLVVSNLLSNAIKYTPPGGSIVLGVRREDSHPGHYRLFVQDTGIGLSKEEADHVLGGSAYYRTERGKAMTIKGLGIGLSLVKLMIEAHGSALELESSPGTGSRFSFLLPEHAPAEQA